MDADKAAALLKEGANWTGLGWNTGRASKRLHDLVGVPLVSADFNQYKYSFLYALAMLWSIEVPTMELSDRASEAAFALVSLFQGPADHGHHSAQDSAAAEGSPED